MRPSKYRFLVLCSIHHSHTHHIQFCQRKQKFRVVIKLRVLVSRIHLHLDKSSSVVSNSMPKYNKNIFPNIQPKTHTTVSLNIIISKRFIFPLKDCLLMSAFLLNLENFYNIKVTKILQSFTFYLYLWFLVRKALGCIQQFLQPFFRKNI